MTTSGGDTKTSGLDVSGIGCELDFSRVVVRAIVVGERRRRVRYTSMRGDGATWR